MLAAVLTDTHTCMPSSSLIEVFETGIQLRRLCDWNNWKRMLLLFSCYAANGVSFYLGNSTTLHLVYSQYTDPWCATNSPCSSQFNTLSYIKVVYASAWPWLNADSTLLHQTLRISGPHAQVCYSEGAFHMRANLDLPCDVCMYLVWTRCYNTKSLV